MNSDFDSHEISDQGFVDPDDPYDDHDLAEDTEPKVWLLTVYPEDNEPVYQDDIADAILVLPSVANVSIKRM